MPRHFLAPSAKGLVLKLDFAEGKTIDVYNQWEKDAYRNISPLVAVCCKTLTWLDLSHNQLDSLVGIQALTNLAGELRATMKAGTEWNEERNENRMWSVNYHARHAETENGLDWSGLDSPKTGKMPFSV